MIGTQGGLINAATSENRGLGRIGLPNASPWRLGLELVGSGRFEETTNNAYLRADITSLAPKVAGYVVEVPVEDNQQVKAGEVLFRIDDRDYKARLAQADANIAAAKAALANLMPSAACRKRPSFRRRLNWPRWWPVRPSHG